MHVGAPSCHAATVAAARDGALVASWFQGEREGAPDVAVYAQRLDEDEPVLVARARDVPCWNPVLWALDDGRLACFYKAGPSPQTWSGRVAFSADGGRTWGGRRPLPPGIIGPAKNKPLRVGDRVLLPSSTESHVSWGCWIEETDPSLESWRKHGPIHMDGVGLIQPTLFEVDDAVVALMRTTSDRVARAESGDGGRTWSPPRLIDVPHNNSGIDAVRLADGRVVLVANAVASGRTPLHVLASHDGAHTFTVVDVLEDAPGEYSYPSVVAHPGGGVAIVYTWRRERIAYRHLPL